MMNLSTLWTWTTRRHDLPNATDRRLRGKMLVGARVAWLVLAACTLMVLLASIFGSVAHPQSTCVGMACLFGQLGLPHSHVLSDFGFFVLTFAAFNGGLAVVSASIWFGVGAVIFWRMWGRSDDWFALLVALLLVLASVGTTFRALEGSADVWQLSARLLTFLAKVLTALFLALFPDGRFVPRWTGWLIIAWLPVIGFLSFFSSLPFSTRVDSPLLRALIVLVIGLIVGLLSAQFYRYRYVSGPVERAQTRWVVLALSVGYLVPIGVVLPVLLFPEQFSSSSSPYFEVILLPVQSLFPLLVPLAIGMAILRYRLWNLDLLINRTLVYGLLTACVIALYVLLVGTFGMWLQAQGNFVVSLLSTGLVAVLFQPLRQRLQRAINRLMYGERDDPSTLLSRLGERLETTLVPSAVLPTIVETVACALHLPYAAILLKQGEVLTKAACYGVEQEDPLVLPLIYQRELVGELRLAPRAQGEAFTPADRRLLEALAHQAGVAASAVRLTIELQRSRERLVTAREEERRRLRRDLHDGLGPTLATMMLTIDAALHHVPSNPNEACRYLVGLKQETQEALLDIRRLVYDLRPPALDELGLVSALREQATYYALNQLRVCLHAPEALSPLPAAVEVAAYRIVREALTNVSRHAHASTCTITIRLSTALTLSIVDDGCGLPEHYHAGVGIASMRERAGELGGSLLIEANPQGSGTRVYAELPLLKEE